MSSFETYFAGHVRRRVRLISGCLAGFTLLVALFIDPLEYVSLRPVQALRFLQVTLHVALILWLRRPWSLRQVEAATTLVWSCVVFAANLSFRWLTPDLLPQITAGTILCVIGFLQLSRLRWQPAAVVLAATWVSGGLGVALCTHVVPSLQWVFTPVLSLPSILVMLIIHHDYRLASSEFDARARLAVAHAQLERDQELRIRGALRAQCDSLLMELHDGVKATLSRAAMLLSSLHADASRVALLGSAETAVRDAIDETNAMLGLLDAAAEPIDSFIGDLRRDLADLSESHDLELSFVVRGREQLSVLPPVIAHALRRIAHEAMTNVVRHASAKRVECELTVSVSALSFRIRDDGHGFAEAPSAGRGLGIVRRRAESLGGEARFGNAAGGAYVEVMLPISAS